MTPKPPQFVTARVAADVLGLDIETVRQMFRDGRLEGFRTAGGEKRGGNYRISRASLEAMGATLTMPRRRSSKAPSARERMKAVG